MFKRKLDGTVDGSTADRKNSQIGCDCTQPMKYLEVAEPDLMAGWLAGW